MRKTCYLLAALAVLAPLGKGATAAETYSGRLSAAFEWFESPDGDRATPLYLYGLLNARDVGGMEGLAFRGYGRLADDLSSEVDRDSRLYYAYLEKKKIAEVFSFRAGRQFVSSPAGSAIIDGLDLDFSATGSITLSALAGVRVAQEGDYAPGDRAYGVSAGAEFGSEGESSLAYYQEWDGGDLDKEVAGLDARYDLADAVELYGAAQYNVLFEQISHFDAEAVYHKDPSWKVRAACLYDIPVFRATSIYSVFAVNEYREASAEVEYDFGGGVRGFAGYTREIYEEFADANVYEAGVEKLRAGVWSGYLVGTVRDDADGQDLKGVKASADYAFSPLFRPGVGIHYDILERRIEDDDETVSRRTWVFVESRLSDAFSLEAKLEHAKSDLYDDYTQGRIRLTYRF